jgi:hypothetical protein
MNLDTIIVFVLALLFFGGIGSLVWNDRRKQKLNMTNPASPVDEVDLNADVVEPRRRRAG